MTSRLITFRHRASLGLPLTLAALMLPARVWAVDTPVTPGASPGVQSLLAYFSDDTVTNKVKIAELTSSTPYSKWPHTQEANSAPVKLEAGKRYYLELLPQQRDGSTHVAVRWQLPDGVEQRPIPGSRLMALDKEVPTGKPAPIEDNSP